MTLSSSTLGQTASENTRQCVNNRTLDPATLGQSLHRKPCSPLQVSSAYNDPCSFFFQAFSAKRIGPGSESDGEVDRFKCTKKVEIWKSQLTHSTKKMGFR